MAIHCALSMRVNKTQNHNPALQAVCLFLLYCLAMLPCPESPPLLLFLAPLLH